MQSKEHGGDTRVTQVDVISLLTSLGWTPLTCFFFFSFLFLNVRIYFQTLFNPFIVRCVEHFVPLMSAPCYELYYVCFESRVKQSVLVKWDSCIATFVSMAWALSPKVFRWDTIHCSQVLRCWQGMWLQRYCDLLTSLLMETLWEVPKPLTTGL